MDEGRLWDRKVDIHMTAEGPPHDSLPGVHAPAVVAADIDGDGCDELLALTQTNRLMVLNGRTGALIHDSERGKPPTGGR